MNCPDCGAPMLYSGEDSFVELWYCEECDQELSVIDGMVIDDTPPADLFGGHHDFGIVVDGHPAMVLGDPNMSKETLSALEAVIRAAHKAVEDGTLDKGKDE